MLCQSGAHSPLLCNIPPSPRPRSIGDITQAATHARLCTDVYATLFWFSQRPGFVLIRSKRNAQRERVFYHAYTEPRRGTRSPLYTSSHLASVCVAVTILTPVISESKGSDERYRDVLLPTPCNRCLLRNK